jgi:hypothetical protein
MNIGNDKVQACIRNIAHDITIKGAIFTCHTCGYFVELRK